MKHLSFLLSALALTAVVPFSAIAQDAQAGKKIALQCQACHGIDGIAKIPETPHIAGQPASYLIKQLTDYKNKVRKHEVMSVMVASLSDKDIANVAAWYTEIEVTAKVK